MSDTRIWLNGTLVDPGERAFLALDHGITVGDGAFETCKIVDGRVFAARRHRERMDASLAGLGLPAVDRDRLASGIDAVLGAGEPIALGRLRYTITAGRGPLGSDRGAAEPTYLVIAEPMDPAPPSVAIATVPWTRNEHSATSGLKTTSYADNVVALAEAHRHGAHEAVLANTRGELCEGTGSNVFVVLDGVVHTPPLGDGALAGVTRGLTIEWARQAGIEVREVPLPHAVLREVPEVFLTSTTKDVMPVHRVDDREVPIGALTEEIARLFAARAAEQIDP